MADQDRIQRGILGDINPTPASTATRDDRDSEESIVGGSENDRPEHSGSRDVTEGVTGGLGTKTGGTRNYRTGTGATGGDIGNRPE